MPSWIAYACPVVLLCTRLSLAQQEFPPVEVASVVESQVRTAHRVVGSVFPLRTSTIGSAVAGRVLAFYVNQGQAVEAGEPLAQLRTETLEIELAAAEAELELYKHQLAELENGSRKEDIAEAAARASGAKSAMENAANQLKRITELSLTRAATEVDVEDARERAEFTRYAFDATQALLERVREGPRIEQVAQAKARVELQEHNVRMIEDRISKHTLIAPFDGFVSAEYTEVGAWIAAGDPIAQVIQLDEVEVSVPVTAELATKLRRGDTIRVEFPELPSKLFTGHIERIVPIAESRSRTFPVLIRLKNEINDGAALLMSGMLARVDLPTGSGKLMPLVPKDALVLNEKERSVFVVALDAGGKTGKVRKVNVELGIAVGSRVQVVGDLAEGDLVVVVGNERLLDGASVSVDEFIQAKLTNR